MVACGRGGTPRHRRPLAQRQGTDGLVRRRPLRPRPHNRGPRRPRRRQTPQPPRSARRSPRSVLDQVLRPPFGRPHRTAGRRAVLDPAAQPRWDGNDNLAWAPAGQRVRRKGEVFTMTLTRAPPPKARAAHAGPRRPGRQIKKRLHSRETVHGSVFFSPPGSATVTRGHWMPSGRDEHRSRWRTLDLPSRLRDTWSGWPKPARRCCHRQREPGRRHHAGNRRCSGRGCRSGGDDARDRPEKERAPPRGH